MGGKIIAEEVRIQVIKDWADVVFSKNYRLSTLPEVERFIQAYHHLPDIPSAAEVETAGVGLGEMQSKLLRKVEVLTLHMIEQHKTIETLQRQLVQIEQDRQVSQTPTDR